jgi:hypothetical protein
MPLKVLNVRILTLTALLLVVPSMSQRKQAGRESASSELSLLVKEKGKCLWQRFDPLGKVSASVAELPASCCSSEPGRVAIAPGAAGALVACQNEPPLLVKTATGAVQPLPRPGRGWVRRLTFGKDGAPLALTVEVDVKFLEDKQGRFVNVDGQRIDADPGDVSLAHAFRLGRGGAWSRVETMADGDFEKVDVLRKLRTGKDRDGVQVSTESLSFSPELDAEMSPVKDPKILARLKALAPELGRPPFDEEGEGWVSYAEHSHSDVGLISWRVIGDDWHLIAPLFFVRGDRLTALEFSRHDQVAVLSRWPYLLIAEEYSGAAPRLYDWRTGALLFASDDSFTAGFWPASDPSLK